METLLFLKPTFRKGLNFTVRLGEKWKKLISPDDIVNIEGGLARIRKIYVCKTAEIPKEVYEKEHDENCKDWDGLMKAMFEAYPELKELGSEELEETTVTCIGFWIYKSQ